MAKLPRGDLVGLGAAADRARRRRVHDRSRAHSPGAVGHDGRAAFTLDRPGPTERGARVRDQRPSDLAAGRRSRVRRRVARSRRRGAAWAARPASTSSKPRPSTRDRDASARTRMSISAFEQLAQQLAADEGAGQHRVAQRRPVYRARSATTSPTWRGSRRKRASASSSSNQTNRSSTWIPRGRSAACRRSRRWPRAWSSSPGSRAARTIKRQHQR